MSDCVIFHLLDFCVFLNVIHATLKRLIKFISWKCREIHLIDLCYSRITHELLCQLNIAKVFVDQGAVYARDGLINDPANPADWYFCSAGVVREDVTQLVLYDNAWFYVVDGKLDTTYVGIVDYDGGRFLVAAGRIMTEVNGLNQDPNGSDWYFYANGQIQNQYTGLAQYDGAWFYIVEGKLAEDFTGDVEYDGAMFHVDHGMLAA